ncbi:hypothetical protein LCGC14_2125550 [marine sediment metagenome]|uniref:Uncharacterized protein n=1 Tax=marine sediment metagenome TaxID=412755 RepID=A0A0F9GG25_9ZZZZ
MESCIVEKTKEQAVKKVKIDFYINAADFMDVNLTNEELENLIRLMNREPNEKSKKFSEEALKFYNDMLIKNQD